MKLKDFNTKKALVLRDLVAFKWVKVNKISNTNLDIYLPDNITDKGGVDRMGHRYTCEALAVGPKVTEVKPGDRFLLHEYDKEEQGETWYEDSVMFCEEGVIPCLLPGDYSGMTPAKIITDKMIEQYEDY